MTAVLVPISGAPGSIVTISSVVIEGKDAAIDFHRVIPPALTGFHEPLFEITPGDVGGTGIATDKYPTPVPERVPPIVVIGSGSLDVHRIHLHYRIAHLILPAGGRAGLRGVGINRQREIGVRR